jgi:hypothetical protein
MVRFETLLAALLVSSPALWDAFTTGNTPVDTALIRFLIAVPVCGFGLMLLRRVFDLYGTARPAVVEAERALEETREIFDRRRADRGQAVAVPGDAPRD